METFHRVESTANEAAGAPVALPDTRSYDLAAAAGGEPWRIFVHIPPTSPPLAGWPLLVATDGNAVIATAVDAMRVQSSYPAGTNVDAGIVVTIGYPGDGAFDPLRRSFDLSPPPGRVYPPFHEGGPEVRTGGAAAFLAFVETELLPFLEALAPIDPARRTLFGHSFGGLFALYALFAGRGAFSRFVAASPTIYWEDEVLRGFERDFMPRGRGRVHLSAGEYEGDVLAPFQYGREDTEKRLENLSLARTVGRAQEMAERLARLPGVEARYETYPGETHMTMLPVAVSRAVGVAFRIETDPNSGSVI